MADSCLHYSYVHCYLNVPTHWIKALKKWVRRKKSHLGHVHCTVCHFRNSFFLCFAIYCEFLNLRTICNFNLPFITILTLKINYSIWFLNSLKKCKNIIGLGPLPFLYIFWRAKGCWPILCLCRPCCIFERCLDSNPESHCRRATHPLLVFQFTVFSQNELGFYSICMGG